MSNGKDPFSFTEMEKRYLMKIEGFKRKMRNYQTKVTTPKDAKELRQFSFINKSYHKVS